MSVRAAAAWQPGTGGVTVRVRVTPKSSNDSIGGLETTADGPAFRARVRAVPADGEANRAVQELLAAWLGVAKSRVRLVSGAKSRVKSFAVSGEPSELAVVLAHKSAKDVSQPEDRHS